MLGELRVESSSVLQDVADVRSPSGAHALKGKFNQRLLGQLDAFVQPRLIHWMKMESIELTPAAQQHHTPRHDTTPVGA